MSDLPWSAIACCTRPSLEVRRRWNGSSRQTAQRIPACRAPRPCLTPAPRARRSGRRARRCSRGVAAGVARLRPPRVRRHHDAALGVHAAAHRGKLWPPVTARGHVDPLGRGRRKSRSSSRETVSTVATLGMPAILTPLLPRPTPNSPGLIRVARVPAGAALGDKSRYPRLYAYT